MSFKKFLLLNSTVNRITMQNKDETLGELITFIYLLCTHKRPFLPL